MNLFELLDGDLYAEALTSGLIRKQSHPEFPDLAILNYTEKCAFSKSWNSVTLTCRGLIFNETDLTVLARPFPKFFNYEELPEEKRQSLLHLQGTISNKMDGSLGILYELPTREPAIATRGSFASTQAIRATRILREKYSEVKYVHGYTPLFEIIYPENRIVVDYGSEEDIFLIGAVEINTGRILDPEWASYITRWPGPVTEIFDAHSLNSAIAMEPRENSEGIVALLRSFDGSSQEMVKIKQEDYVLLHKVITGLSERAVWAAVDWEDKLTSPEEQLERFISNIPDEFYDWATSVKDKLLFELNEQVANIYKTHELIVMNLIETYGTGYTRKDLALYMNARDFSSIRSYIFMVEDKRDRLDISAAVWKTLKPSGEDENTEIWRSRNG